MLNRDKEYSGNAREKEIHQYIGKQSRPMPKSCSRRKGMGGDEGADLPLERIKDDDLAGQKQKPDSVKKGSPMSLSE